MKAMDDIYRSMKPNGVLIFGAPIGADGLFWNAHRVYGTQICERT